jgi:ABC-type antimicrobial peptide transport system ATPase subunit
MEENLLEVRNISVTFKSRYGVLKRWIIYL